MKLLGLKMLLLISWQFMVQKTDYDNFLRYASSNFHLSKSAEQHCSWDYAIIKVTVNSHNVITGYKAMNEVPKDFNNSFKYLIGYKFPSKLQIRNRSVIFGLTINNQNGQLQVEPASDKENKVITAVNKQHQRYPNAVCLDNLITITIDHPAEPEMLTSR